MKTALFCLFTIFFTSFTFSQNVVELVRYSNVQLQGSARFEGMAGSFGALGADLSTSLINPAGYARYSSSQLNLGLNFNNFQNTNTFQGVVTETSRNPVRPSSLGVIIVNDVSHKNKGFLYNQLGFSYNRVDNYTNTIAYKGKLYNSLLDGFAADGDQIDPEYLPPFTTMLAWNTYAIDENGSGGYQPALNLYDTVFHNRSIETKGGVSEYTFSYSTNYINKLYFGINWGIRTIRYTEEYNHNEVVQHDLTVVPQTLNSFDYTYRLTTRGSGNNFKIGVIYLPYQALRLGLSLHTPTYYSLKDEWSATMRTYHANGVNYSIPEGTDPTADYKYRLRTPAKVVGSLAYIFGTHGAINVDMEYLNYGRANLKSTKDGSYEPYNYSSQNKEARELLRSVLNIRVGGELVFQSQYFIRGGFAYYPSPYTKEFSEGTSGMTTYSAGAGIKFGRNTFDLAYKIQSRKYNYYAFAESLTKISSITQGLIFSYSLSF